MENAALVALLRCVCAVQVWSASSGMRLMEIENLFRYTALAVGLMEIENLFRSTALAVGLKPSAMQGKARLRGLYRT